MIYKSFRDVFPKLHPAARVDENMVLLGDVTLEDQNKKAARDE